MTVLLCNEGSLLDFLLVTGRPAGRPGAFPGDWSPTTPVRTAKWEWIYYTSRLRGHGICLGSRMGDKHLHGQAKVLPALQCIHVLHTFEACEA
jgi:hypothetical protein